MSAAVPCCAGGPDGHTPQQHHDASPCYDAACQFAHPQGGPYPHPCDLGEALLTDALEKVERGADAQWLLTAKLHLDARIRSGLPFTTDDLWWSLEGIVSTREPRAMGALIKSAARAGRIRKTGRYIESERPEAHRRPIPVWHPVVDQ